MQYKPCSICNKLEFNRFLPAAFSRIKGSPFEDCNAYVSICRNCGLIFMNPLPDKSSISKFVKSTYSDLHLYGEDLNYKPFFKARLNSIKQLLGSKSPKRVLDIGARSGWFLKMLKDVFKDCEIFGVDPNINAIRFGRERYKLDNLYCNTFEDCEFPDGFFDLIISWTFIYSHDPGYTLKKMKDALKPSGNLYLEFGLLMFNNVHHQWPGYRLDLEDWFCLDPHICYWYHEDHLRSLMMAHNFNILEIDYHTFNPLGYPQSFQWFWCKNEKNTTTLKHPPSLSGIYSKVTDYFFNYSERYTEPDLKELFKTPVKSVGLLGPREHNLYLAKMIQSITPEASLWSADIEPEVWQKERTDGTEITSVKEMISDGRKLDMILVTALLEKEEFQHLAKKLETVSERIYQGFYVRPDRVLKAGSAFYYNPTLKEKRLLKSFVPNLISKKKD